MIKALSLLQMQREDGILEKYLDVLKKTELFAHTDRQSLPSILRCMGARSSLYRRDEFIVPAGCELTRVGIVISGTAQIIKEDSNGARVIVDELESGDIFGEAIACAGVKMSPVAVAAVTDCEIVFIELSKIITTCSSACEFHTRIIDNLLKIIANKNIALNNKIDILSKKNIREKLAAYLIAQMSAAGSHVFDIPFTREELADYICVNRSAMSRELSRMRSEGILDFHRNSFSIKRDLY